MLHIRPASAGALAPTGLRAAGIAGVGAFTADRVLNNFDLEKMVETSDEWIRTRTGISERRIAGDLTTCDLAFEASKRALADAGVTADQVDLILVATVTPDMPFPATACLLQDRLGARRAAALDIEAACSGFVYGLAIARQFVATGCYDTVLVVGAETLSKITDYTDRATCILFGDAAGAAVVRPVAAGSGILATHLGADGSGAEWLKLPAGGSRLPASHETVERRLHYIQQDGARVFEFAVRIMGDAALAVLEQAGLSRDDVDLLIPHQANLRIIQAAARRLGLPMERVLTNIERYGNTSSATIPLALAEAVADGRVGEGDIVVLVAFGGGLTWASAAIRWGGHQPG